MKRVVAACLLIGFGLAPALSDDVPFAQSYNSSTRRALQDSQSLGDIMSLTQLRHTKLWFAGRAGNWRLVSYELQQLNDTFAEAAVRYVGIPVDTVGMVYAPLATLADAAKEKDMRKFASGFDDLTKACNSCHVSGGIEFIRIQTPTSSPFSDQDYSSMK